MKWSSNDRIAFSMITQFGIAESKFVEIETGAELENAISGNTAMMLFLNDNELKGKIKAEELSPKLQKWRRVQAVQSSSFSLLPFQP